MKDDGFTGQSDSLSAGFSSEKTDGRTHSPIPTARTFGGVPVTARTYIVLFVILLPTFKVLLKLNEVEVGMCVEVSVSQ